MKKNSKIFIVAISLFMFLTCCKTNNNSFELKENPVEFDTLLVHKKEHLQNDTANPYCELKVNFVYPVTSRKLDIKRLQYLFIYNTFGNSFSEASPEEAINLYVKKFLKNYEADARVFNDRVQSLNETYYEGDKLDSQHEYNQQQSQFYTYIETLTTNVHFNKNNLLSFQVLRTNDKGKTATYSVCNNFVVNMETGSLIYENDIFKAGYNIRLGQLLASKLLKKNNVNSIYELEELGYFGIDEIAPNRNFLIDDKGITYVFNKGEYSAYLLDAPEIFIPYEDVAMILKENTLIAKLAQR